MIADLGEIVPLRIVVCDERPLVGNGLRTLLASEPDIEVLGTTESGPHAIALARAKRPDVVVTGLRLRGLTGLDFILQLRGKGHGPGPAIVVYPISDLDGTLAEVIRAGVNGVLSEDASRTELVLAVRAVARGQAMLGGRVARRVLDWFRKSGSPVDEALWPMVASLTSREREVLLLTAQGMSIEDVAGKLYIGVATVRTHLYRLRSKLQLRDRAQLVSFAYQAGLMTSSGAR
jgi:DNA-binding NarL/FixJ family response regulator